MKYVCLLVIFIVTTSAQAAKVHLITIADTLDPTIGKSVAVDQKAIREKFKQSITRGEALDIVLINGDRCRREIILQTIQNLIVGTDDAVVVFYAGHGANDPKIGHYLSFPRTKGYLARSELIGAIRSKRGRLGVLSTDCCNTRRTIPSRYMRPEGPSLFDELPPIKAHFRALFFDVAGFVDLTSSKPGEVSISYPAFIYHDGTQYYGHGGLWTTALLKAIDDFRGRPATWAEVIRNATLLTAQEFELLVPDGLDTPDDPAKPQRTQTALASLDVRAVRTTVADPNAMPAFDMNLRPTDGSTWTDHPKQRLGIHGYDSPGSDGLIIYATQPGSPVAKLGLERNDVILSINDNKIRSAKGFHKTLLQAEGVARLTYRDVRTGRVLTSVIRLDDRDDVLGRAEAVAVKRPDFGASGTAVAGGIRVDGVAPGSPSELAGLDPGDVISEINGRPITTLTAYLAAIKASPDEMGFMVLNSRTGQKQGMVVTLDR